jgi:hypothetical protein
VIVDHGRRDENLVKISVSCPHCLVGGLRTLTPSGIISLWSK